MQNQSFWNRKYLQSPVLYNGRTVILNDGRTVKQMLPYALDVRQFIPDSKLYSRKDCQR